MKKAIVAAATALSMILTFLVSCETEQSGAFRIEISDGTSITEDDILYYDSSTCMLFLKDDLFLSYREPESGHRFSNSFTVFVDRDTIYQGVIYPEELITCAGPQMPFVIYRDEGIRDKSILEIRHTGWAANTGWTADMRNDPRIVSALSDNRLLYSGIGLTVDHVEVLGKYTDDTVCCTITLHNPDPINYYVLDPQKMGEDYFNYYNGGLLLTLHNSEYTCDCCGIYQPEYGKITLEDFSILESGASLTFTFCSDDYFIGFDGTFKGIFTIKYESSHLDLKQHDGRIWAGRVSAGYDNIIIDLLPNG
ncbi:MAG: hypothetical protein ABFS28_09575 [Bacteroidota bacterium]